MAEPKKRPFPVKAFVIDTVLTVLFFVVMYVILRGHVPSYDPAMIALWAFLTSACITAVFWLALQMFKVTLQLQRTLSAEKEERRRSA
jgi:drug/metabolite transporter (DMT)-like permease